MPSMMFARSSSADKLWEVLLKHKVSLSLILLHLCLASSGRAENGSLGRYRAVFNTSCDDVWTLSPGISVPALTNFTACVYLKLYSLKHSWTAFIYNKVPDGNASASNHYELGLTGGHDKLTVWIFGKEITWSEKLDENTWYQICIRWKNDEQEVSVYINDERKKTEKISKSRHLLADGQLLLGCSQIPGTSSSSPEGMVGELYMFRMWANGGINYTQDCRDGTIIRWRKDNWVFNKTAEYSRSLPCANAVDLSLRSRKTSSTPADSSIVTFVTYPNGASDSSSDETVNPAEATSGIPLSSATAGTTNQQGLFSVTTGMEHFSEITTTGIQQLSSITGASSGPVPLSVTEGTTSGLQHSSMTIRMKSFSDSADTTSGTKHFLATTGTETFPETTAIDTIMNTGEGGSSASTNVVGTKGLDNNVCNLSALCNDTVFYMGTKNFQTNDNNSDTSYNLKVHYHDTSQYQLKASSTALPEMKISEFNKTLQRLSQSYLLQCNKVDQSSTSECSFIIKLQKNMNISAILSYLKEKAEIGQAESCCCSSLDRHFCPSTVEELRLLQCGMHETVACSGSSTQYVPVSPATPSTVVTQYNAPSYEQDSVSPTPLTEMTTADISSGPATQSTNTFLPTSAPPTKSDDAVTSTTSFETTNSFSSTTSSIKSTTTSVEYSSTPLTAVSTMNISVDVPLTPDKNGSLNKPNTEHVSQNRLNDTDPSNATDFEKIVSQLENNLTAESIAPSFAKSMVDSVSFLLDKHHLQISSMSKRIIQIVDAIGLKLNFSTESISLTSPSLALAVMKVNSTSFHGVSFAVEDSSDLQVVLGTQVPRNSVGAIRVPSSVITNLSPGDKHQASRITFNFFEKTTLFQDPSLKNVSLISHVISSSVANLSITNLKKNVTVTLQNAGPSQENSTVRCAFWDFSKNGGNGGWAYDGCTVKERRTNETVCSCNHLTSFGVLLDLSRSAPPSPIQVLILTFITYIGCGLSAIFLSVTLVTYIAFEKIRRDYPSKILIQLCVALLLLNLVFLLDSWIALYNIRGLCISVAVFLHYFLLVSFTWMGLEAFHMYLALVKVFNTYVRKYILKFCIVGWGVPAVVIAIVLAISPDNYGLGSYGKFPNGSPDEFCWINNNIVFYITVVGYFCMIFLLNISMFIVVLIQLCRIKKKKQLGAQRKTSIQDLRSVAGLTFLLGITWGFAFFAWGPVNLVFMYLFAIFNTLQGFFIFIFYCVAKENVRKQWRRYLCCGKYRLAENSDWSRTATNGLKKQNVNQGVSSSSHSLQSNSNSTNSTSMLMNNDYSVHANGNGNVSSEKNGVSFNVQNGDVRLPDFSAKQLTFQENNDTGHKKSCISLRRTSKRGSLHFIEPM
ncbi:adhesion G-protein coupled receptor G2 isoform X2 [Sceloporus undulatus]|uniref:adhesion G-protein coupled receptor G2 isoform X2 n=1 Tax=Sceloporus undulatus TaxID=8520 RepID=UPI001C4BF019|nr:adhesion G-protein coupled receptor G2 isoform X2 [Sceloporus undulatus]